MNVNTKFSLAQFPAYSPNSPSPVIKGRQGGAPKAAPSAGAPRADDVVKGASEEGLQDAVISDDEKQFFENLFPASAGEIRAYSPYSRGGVKQSAVVGSLVDRKG
jgi:hypothetical protein